jgi:hypothetical protein
MNKIITNVILIYKFSILQFIITMKNFKKNILKKYYNLYSLYIIRVKV